MQHQKVVIVGTGFVGMSYAYALLNQGAAEELVLIDINKEKAEGEAMDLNHGLALASRKMTIRAGDYEDCHDAALLVLTAGVNQKSGESRIDLLNRNARIIKDIVKKVMASGFNGIILVASNPVDILTYVAQKESGLAPSRVIGSGTLLDTSRLRYEISKYLHIDARNIHAYILGEHGDSEFVAWSKAYVGVKPIRDVFETLKDLDYDELERIYERVRDAAEAIISRKSATYYAIGMALVRITNAIFNNENSIIPLSVYNDGVYPIEKDLYIGLPAVVNAQGIDHVVSLKLSEAELEKLTHSAKILKARIDQMTF